MKESLEHCNKELLQEMLDEPTALEPHQSSADLTGALVRERVIRIVVCDEGCRGNVSTAVKGLQKVGCELQVSILILKPKNPKTYIVCYSWFSLISFNNVMYTIMDAIPFVLYFSGGF